LESRPVKDDIYNKFIQTICEDSPEDMEEMLHGQGQDLLTGLLFAGHHTIADTMVFTVKYVGENPHVLVEIWVIPSPSARSCHKIHYSSSS
jgi:cytochrome P450